MTRPNADLDHLDRNGRSIAVGDCVRWVEEKRGAKPTTWEGKVVEFRTRKTDSGEPYEVIVTDNTPPWILLPWMVELAEPWMPRDVMP